MGTSKALARVRAGRDLAGAVQRDDVRVRQARGDRYLALEAASSFGS
jgi:hypothetical protein